MKLPLPSWKDRLPRRRKTADTAAAAEPVAGAHRKKKKTRKLKKKVVIPLAVVGVAGIAFGVHHVLTAGSTDIVQTFTESEATRQDNGIAQEAQRVVRVADGKIIFDGPAREAFPRGD